MPIEALLDSLTPGHPDEALARAPDADLLIRTSGEMRVGNFLLWQIACAELYVTETLWPDFTSAHLLRAILDYHERHRRFGGLGGPAPAGVEPHYREAFGIPLARGTTVR